MTKTYKYFLLAASVSLLSACFQTSSHKPLSYPSQAVPAKAPAAYSIDTSRYSAMHITQSAYLFK